MKEKYVLDSLEVEGFRGYLKPIRHDVGEKSVLIFGPQGSGKSSTLNAIEWGLFGKIAYFKSAESKSDIELINSRALNLECRVTISLKNEESFIKITRTKKTNSKESEVTVKAGNITRAGREAEDFLFSELGLTFDDFYRSIYLHQESIRAIITDDPRNRDEAIDRLLGLEKARDIIGSIPMSKVKSVIEELTTQRDKITAKLQGAIQQISEEVKKAESEAQKEGFQDDQLTSSQVSLMLGELQGKLNKLSSESQLESPNILLGGSNDAVLKSITRSKTFLRQCRKRIIEITGVDDLREKQSRLKQVSKDLKRITNDVETKTKDANLIKQEFGGVTKIEESIEAATKELEELNNKQEALDVSIKLAKDALFFFEDPSITSCPVCKQPIVRGEVKKHLDEIVESVKDQKANEIYENIKSLNDMKKTLFTKKEDLQRLEKSLTELKKELDSIAEKVKELTTMEVRVEEIEKVVDETLSSLQTKIDQSNKVYQKRNELIEEVDLHVDRIKVVTTVLLKREEYQAMEKRSREEIEESKGISQAIREVESFKSQLETLVRVLSNVQTSSATQSISETQDEVTKLYLRLRAHPYFDRLSISVTSKNVSGVQKNTYLIKASSVEESRDTFVSSRFSTGQINCAALAIFLSLAKLSSNGIGFVMLDDPSQSLDLDHSEGLSEILAEVGDERQVILATQDQGLFDQLNRKFRSHSNFVDIRFQPWTKNGCSVEGQPKT